jgi:hypothetical protein
MAKQRIDADRKRGSTPRVPGQPAPHDLVTASVPTISEMMVMSGNKPHETLLHDFVLEDFGLEVLDVIFPNRV